MGILRIRCGDVRAVIQHRNRVQALELAWGFSGEVHSQWRVHACADNRLVAIFRMERWYWLGRRAYPYRRARWDYGHLDLAMVVGMQHSCYGEQLAKRVDEWLHEYRQELSWLDSLGRFWWYRWLLLPGFPVRWLVRKGLAWGVILIERVRPLLRGRSYIEIVHEAERQGLDFWLMLVEARAWFPFWAHRLILYCSLLFEILLSCVFYIFVYFWLCHLLKIR
ncbi:hypothetical protein GBSOP10_10997 [Armatimonadetes bacterium GBS]|nr:hypothetical protein HRbin14_01332 [bacterium HR14]CUU11106.1 hypothetical protein GBSOP10_10997 [Armatimonadetes bacterium GBS]